MNPLDSHGGSSTSLDNYEFTFEAFLQDSARIEPDVSPSYHYPNDPTENERLDDQHDILRIVLDGRNHLAPFSRANPPRRVLDVATGTGTWAIEMGDEYPESQIAGTDLSPIQPSYVPPNVRFFVEDSGEDWHYTQKFDYIHTRMTLGCCLRRPLAGGYFECQEVLCLPSTDDDTLPASSALLKWMADLKAASDEADRVLYLGPLLRQWLEEVGFQDVREVVYKIPVNGWPRGRALKQVGQMWQRNLVNGLSGFSLGLLGRVRGRSVEDIERQLVDVRRELFDQTIHAYQKFYVVWGRKPEA
ncbi:S-adenosyl-L-methionine-dependent methyltransferase [Coniochaeta ligniaria NRRL 30616]|uniref:S-adenosyl-L-methionine-dependent methyltransferase n=1 Tax=Coniochaeta ligniaria NRRL 30616 TaxID=1408157 RepID=A0A1J7J6Z6_9PEZI|nr:S-adenosyl-L-methionine-dependent methyltransferase [Coniochaeta ligniaria NRRL 30616]